VTARPHPRFGLRPFLPADAPLLADIFRNSIAELAEDDYNPAQQDAWASAADNLDAFSARLSSALTLVATMEGASPVGFIVLKGPDEIDMLYVHPSVARKGVATMLLDAIERLAGARGATRLTAQVSDSAQPFFAKHGFVGQQRNSVMRGGEWLANTTMEKKLGSPR
jgi:putative acetyltransferase